MSVKLRFKTRIYIFMSPATELFIVLPSVLAVLLGRSCDRKSEPLHESIDVKRNDHILAVS